MQSRSDCESYLASRLRESWQSHAVDFEQLAKQLIVSPKQIQALQTGDAGCFHTYGIYLRTLRQALEQAQILHDPLVLQCLETLVTDYISSPQTSEVLRVKHTVNKKLAEVSPDTTTSQTSNVRALVATALGIGTLLCLMLALAVFSS